MLTGSPGEKLFLTDAYLHLTEEGRMGAERTVDV